MKFSTRDYKIALTFLFLGFIASCVLFFKINAHEIWYWRIHYELNKLQVDTVKMQGKIEGFDEWIESWNVFKAEIEEALDIIFSRPEEAK